MCDPRERNNDPCADEMQMDEEVYDLEAITKHIRAINENVTCSTKIDEDIVDEFLKLSDLLGIPETTHSLTKIHPKFGQCMNYDMKSGRTHFNMRKFSPLSRGRQGTAIAMAALATSWLLNPRCWNEDTIDQIVEDGDTHYCESYRNMNFVDREAFGLRDLKRELVTNDHTVRVIIHEPKYVGTFRSMDPTELHLVKALELYFRSATDLCILESPVLNAAIWRDGSKFHVFDGGPRDKSGKVVSDKDEAIGSAKLFTVRDLTGVAFLILERSNVNNEPFVLYNVVNAGAKIILRKPDDLRADKPVWSVRRAPSAYQIKTTFRAIVQGSYHLAHSAIPEELHNQGHLVLGMAALIYSKLASSSKWTTALIDVIFNQSHLYLMDLLRVSGKNFDGTFELGLNDLFADIILGVYKAKVKITANVVPGQGKKKGKTALNTNIREFFQKNDLGILEIKKKFYGVWKQDGKYYFFDPFACDHKGFRVSPTDPETAEKYKKATSCLAMNSSVNELVEIILENTGSTEKDVAFLHGVRVLYIKSGVSDQIVYRDKNTNRRPHTSEDPRSNQLSDCDNIFDEILTSGFDGYRIVQPHVVVLKGTKNRSNEEQAEESRAIRGAVAVIVSMAKSKMKNLSSWYSSDVDKVIDSSDKVFQDVLSWMQQEKSKRIDEGETQTENQDAEMEPKEKEGEELTGLDLSLFPEELTFDDIKVIVKKEMNVGEGSADPLASLTECWEHCFKLSSDLVMENSTGTYGLWKRGNRFFLFNSYGHNDLPSLKVTDSVNELTNLLAKMFASNDKRFKFHTITIDSIKPIEDDPKLAENLKNASLEAEKELLDLTDKLHLLLLTSTIRNEEDDAEFGENMITEDCPYEKMKLNLPNSFVLPQKKVLCTLLTAKSANKSDCSLLSRFSVDSRLAAKDRSNLDAVQQMEEAQRMSEMNVITDEEEKPDEDRKNSEIAPTFIPLGPTIQTPLPKIKTSSSDQTKAEKDKFSDIESSAFLLGADDIIFNLLFPTNGRHEQPQVKKPKIDEEMMDEETDLEVPEVRVRDSKIVDEEKIVDDAPVGFQLTEDEENVAIVRGTVGFEDRQVTEERHFKPCFFSAMLCILGKTIFNQNSEFRNSILDQFILDGKKMYEQAGKLKYHPYRRFYNIEIFNAKFDVIAKQVIYADPENFEPDSLEHTLDTFFKRNSTGILVFDNASYAFWYSGDYFLFDSYGCDKNGIADNEGTSCITLHSDRETLLSRIMQNTEDAAKKPYRIFTLTITRMIFNRPKADSVCSESEEESDSFEEPTDGAESDSSLIELRNWAAKKGNESLEIPDHSAFHEILHGKALAFEVPLLEKDATGPELALFMKKKKEMDLKKLFKQKLENKQFENHAVSCILIDVCVMAWSCIYEPSYWSVSTVRGLFEACKDFMFGNVNIAQNMSTSETDFLPEIPIANYNFRPVFAPLIQGTLYATEGWNLARCLKKVFDVPIYIGVIISAGKTHVGAMTSNSHFYTWWPMIGTKNLRIMVAKNLEHLLELIVREMGTRKDVEFLARPVMISYARKMDPDGADAKGLHEISTVPATCRLHDGANLEIIFNPAGSREKQPQFVLGTAAMSNRNELKEPTVKQCYFVALLAVMMKNDVVQCPTSEVVDNLLQMAGNLTNEFDDVEYHTDLMLKNVPVRGRLFHLRDQASSLVPVSSKAGNANFSCALKKHLKQYFRKNNGGIVHFTNCCYGFWYSEASGCYYYLDPYQCNAKGKKVSSNGAACLGIFPTLCCMVKNMCFNRFESTTGFFVHSLHIESVDSASSESEFKEDPMWIYLDYHWQHPKKSDVCPSKKSKSKNRMKNTPRFLRCKKATWNYYIVDVPSFIFSLWGSIGCHDEIFRGNSGKNRMAICVALLAADKFVHPDMWSPDFLDFVVVQGDIYYAESLKKSARKLCHGGCDLLPELTIYQSTLSVQFHESVCGTLYDDRKSLAMILRCLFCEGTVRYAILECGELCFAIFASSAFYLVDCCWVGPPLFSKSHSAAYVLRCENIDALIYAAFKILNTNLKLKFQVTSVSFVIKDPTLHRNNVHKLMFAEFEKNFKSRVKKPPGKVKDAKTPMVPGSVTVPNSNTLLCYRENLELGLKCVEEFRNRAVSTSVPVVNCNNLHLVLATAAQHVNTEQMNSQKSSQKPFDLLKLEKAMKQCFVARDSPTCFDPFPQNRVDLARKYPQIIDFVKKRIDTLGHIHLDIPEIDANKPMDHDAKFKTGILTRRGNAAFTMFNEKLKHEKFEKPGKDTELKDEEKEAAENDEKNTNVQTNEEPEEMKQNMDGGNDASEE